MSRGEVRDGFVNVKFPIPTTQHKLESWLLYFEECGYTVVENAIEPDLVDERDVVSTVSLADPTRLP